MTLQLRAISPRGPLIVTRDIEARLKQELNAFTSLCEEDLSTYPKQWPQSAPKFGKAKHKYKTRPAGRRVLKSGYRRTMTLAKSWSRTAAKREGNSIVAKVGSNAGIAPYNRYVQGKDQSRDMQKRGWKTARFVVLKHWAKTVMNVHRIFKEVASQS